MRPDDAQLAAHKLSRADYELAAARVGRDLSWPELGVLSVLWSEHCSYRSSKHLLARLPRDGAHVLVGAGENAGAIDIGEGLALVFKIESHNHPSYIEPHQGAATGLGGILRDVFTMGARPLVALDSLRFGAPEHPRTRHLLRGVVGGIARYGNCFGVPTVGGELAFHPSYDGNCLVNVFAAGYARHERLMRGVASGVGNPVIYLGARTGRDGIHGATMASASFDDDAAKQRPAVQIGDPFHEKLLLEACLELIAAGLVVGLQDMGAAGLTSSSVEMAARAGHGLELWLDAVPTREPDLDPYELLLSESQERMLLVTLPQDAAAAIALAERWGLEAVVVGQVLAEPRWRCTWYGEDVCDLPVALLTDEVPPRVGPASAPAASPSLTEEPPCADPSADLLRLVAQLDHADKRWITEQYDHQVGASTVARPGGDAAVLRVPDTAIHLAFTLDGSARHVVLNPKRGAAGLVAEAARNLACVGARAIGATDGLNLGSPEQAEVRWQLAQVIEGLREASLALKIPFVSGNVSLYNQTSGRAIAPTPIVGLVGKVDGPWRGVRRAFGRAGLQVALLGAPGSHGVGGSAWLAQALGRDVGPVPAVDLDAEQRLYDALIPLISAGIVQVAHDLSDGGLALALAECCLPDSHHPLMGLTGALPAVTGGLAARLFGEDHGRALIAYAPERHDAVLDGINGVPLALIGRTGGERLALDGALDVSLAQLHELWSRALPRFADAAAPQEPR